MEFSTAITLLADCACQWA